MHKIAIVGAESSILIFKFLNVDIFPVSNRNSIAGILRKIIGRYSIIFMEELFIDEARNLLSESDPSTTTIVPLPLYGKPSGNAAKRIKDFIRKAIGISE